MPSKSYSSKVTLKKIINCAAIILRATNTKFYALAGGSYVTVTIGIITELSL